MRPCKRMAQDRANNAAMPVSSLEIKPPIDSLPPEILEMVVADLHSREWDAEGLRPLRLTNKAFHAAAAKPFSNFFNNLERLVLERSLRTLLEIAEHPAFGPSIETITLGTAVVPRLQAALVLDSRNFTRFSDLELDETDCDLIIGFKDLPYPNFDEEERDRIYEFVDHFRAYEAFINSSQPQDLLDHIFKKLQSYGTRVTIGVYDDALCTGYGNEYYSNLSDHRDNVFRKARLYPGSVNMPGLMTGRVLDMLKSAADAAQCSLQGLHLSFNVSALSENEPLRSEEQGLDAALNKILVASDGTRVQDLDLELYLTGLGDEHCQRARLLFATSRRRLELENIDIGAHVSNDAFFDIRSLNMLAPHLQSIKICSLKLHNCMAEAKALRSLLCDYKISLTELILDNVGVFRSFIVDMEAAEEAQCLVDMSSWIKMHLSLDHVEINYRDLSFNINENPDALLCSARGKGKVQAALGEQVEMLTQKCVSRSTSESDAENV